MMSYCFGEEVRFEHLCWHLDLCSPMNEEQCAIRRWRQRCVVVGALDRSNGGQGNVCYYSGRDSVVEMCDRFEALEELAVTRHDEAGIE